MIIYNVAETEVIVEDLGVLEVLFKVPPLIRRLVSSPSSARHPYIDMIIDNREWRQVSGSDSILVNSNCDI